MTSENHLVRRADESESDAITDILSNAFLDDPVAQWVFPTTVEERMRLHPDFFRPFVDLALAEGQVFTTSQYAGATVWLDVDVNAHSEPATDLLELFVKTLGDEYAARFLVLDELFTANHPTHESHAYLAFIGVRPEWQGQGVGTALLCDRYPELDTDGRPAYLEASSPRNRDLYHRLGFQHTGKELLLPDGPPLWPMWRVGAR